MLLNSRAQHFKNGPRNKRLIINSCSLKVVHLSFVYIIWIKLIVLLRSIQITFLTTRLHGYKIQDVTYVRDKISLLKWLVKTQMLFGLTSSLLKKEHAINIDL